MVASAVEAARRGFWAPVVPKVLGGDFRAREVLDRRRPDMGLEVVCGALRPLLGGVDVAPEEQLLAPEHPDVHAKTARGPIDRDAHVGSGSRSQIHGWVYPFWAKPKRAKGIEPSSMAWKATALPLSYARAPSARYDDSRARAGSTRRPARRPQNAGPGLGRQPSGRRVPDRHGAGQDRENQSWGAHASTRMHNSTGV